MNKNKIIFIYLFAIFGFLSISSVSCLHSETKIHLIPEGEHALIWKIEGNGMKQPSFILGTMHFQHGRILEHIEGWEEAYNTSEQVCVEAIIDSTFKGTNMVSNFLKLVKPEDCQMPFDTSYYFLLKEKYYNIEKWKKYFNFRPFVIRGAFQNQIQIQAINDMIFNREHSIMLDKNYITMDVEIQNRARNDGKKIIALDDYKKFQELNDSSIIRKIRKFLAVPLKKDVNKLYFELIHLDSIKNIVYSWDTAYYNHDFDRLSLMFKVDSASYSKELIHERNEMWIPKIVKQLHNKSTLFAVGIGHLVKNPDDCGILQKLRELGYKVTPYIKK